MSSMLVLLSCSSHQKSGMAMTAARCMPAVKTSPTGLVRRPSCVKVGTCHDTHQHHIGNIFFYAEAHQSRDEITGNTLVARKPGTAVTHALIRAQNASPK